MKLFRNHFIVVILLLVTTNSFAQFRVGLKVGFNLANRIGESFYSDVDFEFKPGFHVGPTAEFKFTKLVSLEAGLILSRKGWIRKQKDIEESSTIKETLYYLEIPLTSNFIFDISKVKAYVSIGPYFGLGLLGYDISEWTYRESTGTNFQFIRWGGYDEMHGTYRRYDLGLMTGGGIEIKSIQIGLFYNIGLLSYTYEPRNVHQVFGVSLGFKFGSGR
jgi:hypothetical protein